MPIEAKVIDLPTDPVGQVASDAKATLEASGLIVVINGSPNARVLSYSVETQGPVSTVTLQATSTNRIGWIGGRFRTPRRIDYTP